MANISLFSFESVRVDAPSGPVLQNVNGAIPDAGVTVIVGPSGAGKSTLLRLCNRLEVPTAGRVLYRGDDIAGLDPLQLRRDVGLVFPTPVLLGGTVADELRLARPEATDAELAAVLGRAELPADYLARDGGSLSTGEAQRVCLARTLLTEPEVLLGDEPTASVDARLRAGLEVLARRLADAGMPQVWVTHDLDQARRLADHLIVMIDGRIVAQGDPAAVAIDVEASGFLTGSSDAG